MERDRLNIIDRFPNKEQSKKYVRLEWYYAIIETYKFMLELFFWILTRPDHKLLIPLAWAFGIVPEPPIRSYLFRFYEIAACYIQFLSHAAW